MNTRAAVEAAVREAIDPAAAARAAVAGAPARRLGPPTKQRGRTGTTSWDPGQHKRGPGGQFANQAGKGDDAPPAETAKRQRQLKDAGDDPGKVDGVHGPKTAAATQKFQKRNGLAETGSFNEETTATLDARPPKSRADAEREQKAAEKDAEDKPKGGKGKSTGSKGTGKGSRSGSAASGGGTSAAGLDESSPESIKAFQRDHGLKVDGIIGPKTEAMITRSRDAEGSRSGSSSGSSSRERGRATTGKGWQGDLSGEGVLRSGDGTAEKADGEPKRKRGDGQVRLLQAKLEALGYDLGDTGVDGRFGTKTTRAVKALQRDLGLKADGVVGGKTKRLLNLLGKAEQKRDRKRDGALTIDQVALAEASTAVRRATLRTAARLLD